MSGNVMIIGLGDLTKAALQIMTMKPEIKKIIVAGRDAQKNEFDFYGNTELKNQAALK